jgi:acetylornithine deacetylase/succinyl-diaminopimelate desuccinylase-like protein
MSLVSNISQQQPVKAALKSFHDDLEQIVKIAISIQQIPAPTFYEAKRAQFVAEQFRVIGLQDVQQDSIQNVYGRLASGQGAGSPVIISAHTDTVFPEGTDLTVRYDNGKLNGKNLVYGPGLADNAMGVAGLISLAMALRRFDIEIGSDIWFVANVGEEGLGDLRGMRAVVDRFGEEAKYIVIEGGSFGYIFHKAVGVRRYRIEIKTSGGHSWGDYGRPNAIHIMGRLIAALDQLALPQEPKTTLNIGVIEGGTSVNTIASEVSCQLDLRSTDMLALERLVASVEEIVFSINQPEIQIELVPVGNRPPGQIGKDSPLVILAEESLQKVGFKRANFMAGSTDANLPLSRGIPAVCIGIAQAANTHRKDEYLDPSYLPQGMGQLLLLALAAAANDMS